jgi:hypothetical protein
MSAFQELLSQVPVAYTYNPSYSGGRAEKDLNSKPALGQLVHKTLSQKYPTHTKKRTGRVAQVIEHLPST